MNKLKETGSLKTWLQSWIKGRFGLYRKSSGDMTTREWMIQNLKK